MIQKGDWAADMYTIDHRAAALLSLYKEPGVPIVSIDDTVR